MDGSVMPGLHFPFGKSYLAVEIEWLLSPLKPKTRIRDFIFGVITAKVHLTPTLFLAKTNLLVI